MDHARFVLCRILPPTESDGTILPVESRLAQRELHALMGKVVPEVFPKPYRFLYMHVERYATEHGGAIPDREVFEALVLREEGGEADPSELVALYEDLAALSAGEDKVRFCLGELIRLYEAETWNRDLTEAHRIATVGIKERDREIKGVRESKEFLLRRVAEGDLCRGGASDEMDGRDANPLRESYEKARATDVSVLYCPTGYAVYDRMTDGAQPGDMWVTAGYTAHGKSNWLVNVARNAAVKYGKNVAYFSTEMPKEAVQRRFYACHSYDPQFGLERGVRVRDLKRGSLSEDVDERFWGEIVPDLEENPRYGKIQIGNVPRGSQVSWVFARALRYAAEQRLDAIFLDYVTQLRGSRRFSSRWEELDDVLTEAKQHALGFDNGRGVWLSTACQINREGWELAQKAGRYTLNSFRGSAEIANSADVALYLLRTEEDVRYNQVKTGILKAREGEEDPEPTTLFADYGAAFIGEIR